MILASRINSLVEIFLGIFVHHFPCVFEFTLIETLTVNEFPDFYDDLAGPSESCYFDSYMCEISLLCMYKGLRNKN